MNKFALYLSGFFSVVFISASDSILPSFSEKVALRDGSIMVFQSEQEKKYFDFGNLIGCYMPQGNTTHAAIVQSFIDLREKGDLTLKKKKYVTLAYMLDYIDAMVVQDASAHEKIIDAMCRKIIKGKKLRKSEESMLSGSDREKVENLLVSRMRFLPPFGKMPVSSQFFHLPCAANKPKLEDISYDGTRVIISGDNCLKLFDIPTQKELFSIPVFLGDGAHIDFSPDESKIVVLDCKQLHIISAFNGSVKNVPSGLRELKKLKKRFCGTDTLKVLDNDRQWSIDLNSALIVSQVPTHSLFTCTGQKTAEGDSLDFLECDHKACCCEKEHRNCNRFCNKQQIFVCNDTLKKYDLGDTDVVIPGCTFETYIYQGGKYFSYCPESSVLQISTVEFTEIQKQILKNLSLFDINLLRRIETKNNIKQEDLDALSRRFAGLQDGFHTVQEAKELFPWIAAYVQKAKMGQANKAKA